MRLLLSCLLAGFGLTPLILLQAQSYSFSTVAGLAGSSGSSDGTNSSARFYYPAGIALDRAGNLYVTEILNHTVRMIQPIGTNFVVRTLAGMPGVAGSVDGTNGEARFDHPNGITVDPAGNLFVADHYNHTIRKIAPIGSNWVVNTVAGSAGIHDHDDGTNSIARFYSPTGITSDGVGHFFVADTANFTIREITSAGTDWVVSTLAGLALNYGFVDGINDQARFDFPFDLKVSSAGVLYVTDWGNHAIREISASGSDWNVDTIAGLSGTMGSIDGTGRKAKFNFPSGIAIDSESSLYVADQENHTLRRITRSSGRDWTVSTIGGLALEPGTADGSGSDARFNKPWGVAVDAAGLLYVADYANHTIRMGVPPWGPVPTLQIQFAGDQVVLSWPATATNFLPETRVLLTGPAAWLSLTNNPAIIGSSLVVTDRLENSSAFYRLRKR